MGDVAPFGIAGGRRVPVDSLLEDLRSLTDDPFTRKVLRANRFLDVADRIAARESLTLHDISRLYTEASVPVLLKLASFKQQLRQLHPPVAAMLLPFWRWLEAHGAAAAVERALWFLEQSDYEGLRVILDRLELDQLDEGVGEALRQISVSFPHCTLVGPSAEDILVRISQGDLQLTALRTVQFVRQIGVLKNAGLQALRPSSLMSMARVVSEAGLQMPIITPVDLFESPQCFAEKLLRINEISGADHIVKVWTPCLGGPMIQNRVSQSARDIMLLRALAVGAICLDNVPFIRASSRFLSFEALHMAALFGANDCGVGAINEETSRVLRLLPYDALLRVTARPGAPVIQRAHQSDCENT